VDQDEARRAYGAEIDQVLGWAEAVARQAGVPMILPNSLR
jgi:hypothetical protein